MKPTQEEKQESAPTISTKDQKILWGRAAQRCSQCKCELVIESDKDPEGTIGEMAHIVGEKKSKTSPRGDSKMPLENRGGYSNRLLLCANHHTEIDTHTEKYTVEELHRIKDDHEQWVSDSLSLSEKTIDPDTLVYAHVIDRITVLLDLEHWGWFSGNAIRQLVPDSFTNCESRLAAIQLGFFDIFDASTVDKTLTEMLKKMPAEFWEHTWNMRIQDNSNVRDAIKRDMDMMIQNWGTEGANWFDGLRLIKN